MHSATSEVQAAPASKVADMPQETAPSGWDKLIISKLQAKDGSQFSEAWALFSSGGWADAGQIIVLGNSDKALYHAYFAKPGSSEITSDRLVSADEFNNNLGSLVKEAAKLDNLAPVAFDALTFYYEHARVAEDGKVIFDKRLVIRPLQKVKSPAHESLIAGFQKLR